LDGDGGESDIEMTAVLNARTADLAAAVRLCESLARTIATYAAQGVTCQITVEPVPQRGDVDADIDSDADA
jgi:hypothetical protein